MKSSTKSPRNSHFARVLDLPLLREAHEICCYVSLPDEVDTRPLIEALWSKHVLVSAPKIISQGGMVAVVVASWDDLAPGRFGIMEPIVSQTIQDSPDVIILPGQQFTRDGDRQGRGHGYYDRFLAAHPAAIRVALCTEDQLVDRLPIQAHDQPVDWIITEQRTLETHAR